MFVVGSTVGTRLVSLLMLFIVCSRVLVESVPGTVLLILNPMMLMIGKSEYSEYTVCSVDCRRRYYYPILGGYRVLPTHLFRGPFSRGGTERVDLFPTAITVLV